VARTSNDQAPIGFSLGDAGLRKLPAKVGALILLSALGALLTATVLEIQAGATAYIVGESHWSKAQQQAVHSLYRYVTHADPADLQRARQALLVPLGDRQARLALERNPVNLRLARKGFLQGGNAPQDVDRLIRMYRLFAGAPYFRDSVRLWREAEIDILRLVALAEQIQQDVLHQRLDPDRVAAYQQRLLELDERLRVAEIAFSRSLVEGARFLRLALIGISVLAFMALTWYALALMRRTLRHVRETESEFRVAFHQAVVGMLKLDRQGRVTRANEALAKILDRPLEQLKGLPLNAILHPQDLQLTAAGTIDWVRMLEPGDRRLLREDGKVLWVRWTASMIVGAHADVDRIFVVVEDVSKARELASEIAHQASHDELTGLINRREIERRLGHAIATVRQGGASHSLCFIDLDQFKVVNDTCGHAAGDQFLREFSATLAALLRGGDWVGRLGGDEFAILLEGTGLEDAERAAMRIHERLGQTTFHWAGRRFVMGCSIGVAEINHDTLDSDLLLRAADTACYLAKEEGRNRVRCYRDADRAIVRRHNELEWVTQTQLAIAENRLLLYAQRIHPLNGEDRLQYEVLVRLAGEEGQLVLPGFFLPAMERYGQASTLDRHVVGLVFAAFAGHQEHLDFLDLCHINLSAQSIVDIGFREYVTGLLDDRPALAHKLCFEITETAVIGNLADARGFIDAMRARGCRIALDDFGSGLSSFGYLKSLPVDILKIDGVFIRDLGKDDVDLALVRSISQVGHALGKVTIAEWVETEAALAQLAEVGVDYAQGYAIHVPCPLHELMQAWPPVTVDTAAP
jgi:diguanylate cyclase (GGDEF)-like protein/PAS domain S-box-containing protein